MSSVLIGLDIGTSSVKASAFDAKGHLLGKASSPVEVFSPHPGWAEQSPNEWWKSACQVLREVVKEIDPLQIAAIGLSGQCPGHVLIDAEHQPIGQAIIWRDQRATEEATWLKNNISDSQAMEWTGSGYLGDATSPPARLLWLNKHRPDQVEKSIAIIQPKDFIAARLTGKIHTDINSAYCLAHPDTGKYDPQYFQTLGFPIEKMPAALKATSLAGEVTDDASRQTGIPTGVKVIIGTIDAYCDNLAGGVIYPGRAVDVAGTSEIVSLAVSRKLDAPGVFPANLDESGYFLCGPMQSGGDTLNWLANCFYPEFGRTINYQELEKDAQSVPAGSDGLVFLPYLKWKEHPSGILMLVAHSSG